MRYDRSKMHSSIWRTNQIPSLSMVGWIETLNSTIFRHLDRRRTYHWIAGIDTNDVEFVPTPCNNNDGSLVHTGLGRHSIEIRDHDLCSNITMDENAGVPMPTLESLWQPEYFV